MEEVGDGDDPEQIGGHGQQQRQGLIPVGHLKWERGEMNISRVGGWLSRRGHGMGVRMYLCKRHAHPESGGHDTEYSEAHDERGRRQRQGLYGLVGS